jgi:outer membrane lipoprotein carrier protein
MPQRLVRSFARLTLLVPAAVTAQAGPAEQAIDRAVAAYRVVRTVRASFEQRISNALTGSTIPSRGEFEQSRPDRFAFRFAEPKGDVILSDGKFVWLYLPSSTPGQVIRAPLTADLEGSIDLIGAFFSNPRLRYSITDAGEATVGGRTTRAVDLVPKKGDVGFSKARVWIDSEDGMLRQFEAQETSGIIRHVRIIRFEPNAQVSPTAFTFSVPKGVKVVDGAGFR